jgi:basic amino acid/polyamine antiporter, APA family
VFNIRAVFIVAVITVLLTLGTRESATVNAIMVVIKLAILIFFIVVVFTAFHGANFVPFAPEGVAGVTAAAGVIFFAYIGFDAVSTGSEESKSPGRDLPIAVIGSLLISTSVRHRGHRGHRRRSDRDTDRQRRAACRRPSGGRGHRVGRRSASPRCADRYHQRRAGDHVRPDPDLLRQCRDGLFPRRLAHVHPRFGTPARLTIGFGILIALLAAFVPLGATVELVNVGTLFAFVLVNIGVIVLRRTRPDMNRPFRVPFSLVFPLIGVAFCVYLMAQLPGVTWVRFLTWLVVGLIIYFGYSRRHSRARLEAAQSKAALESS